MSEQHGRRSEQDTVAEQTQPSQQILRIPAAGFIQAADVHCLGHCIANLRHVQIVDGPAVGGLVLPSLVAVHALEENSVVFVGQHGPRGVANAQKGGSSIPIRWRGALTNVDRDYLAILCDPYSFHGWEHGRIDPLDFSAHFLNRSLSHLLAYNVAIRRHAEQYVPAPLVEHGAQGLRCLLACARRALELLCLGLAFCRQGFKLVRCRDGNGSHLHLPQGCIS